MTVPAVQPALGLYDVADLPEHMQQRIVIDGEGCWLWQTSLDQCGYGRCSLSFSWTTRRRWSAHRLAYMLLVGPIEVGLHLDHLCRVRHCVNPAHLEPVTPAENTRRSLAADFWRSKTHCPRGHAYDEANTGRSTRGARICRACARDKMRAKRGTDPRHFKITTRAPGSRSPVAVQAGIVGAVARTAGEAACPEEGVTVPALSP